MIKVTIPLRPALLASNKSHGVMNIPKEWRSPPKDQPCGGGAGLRFNFPLKNKEMCHSSYLSVTEKFAPITEMICPPKSINSILLGFCEVVTPAVSLWEDYSSLTPRFPAWTWEVRTHRSSALARRRRGFLPFAQDGSNLDAEEKTQPIIPIISLSWFLLLATNEL